jgi:hypothetical protein
MNAPQNGRPKQLKIEDTDPTIDRKWSFSINVWPYAYKYYNSIFVFGYSSKKIYDLKGISGDFLIDMMGLEIFFRD